ncbi:MAG TPA: hypothetical protein VGG03_14610 [Thermoanaerobaculia bacterium]|jgi:hypothetical protein
MKSLAARKTLSWVLVGGLLVSTLGTPIAAATSARDILGVAHSAGRYNFTEEDYLNEGADRILELGSRVIKVFLTPEKIQDFYSFNSDWSPATTDVVELAQRPYFQSLFAKPFSTFILVVSPVTGSPQFLDGFTHSEAEAERDQMYRLAKYFLTTYANSDKTFILQNWEGDHLLRYGLGAGVDPNPVRIQGMIDWWNVRQDGVRQARQEVGEQGVEVLHAAEVNLVEDAMAGKVSATNNVLPATESDLYSYSSWDVKFTPQELTRALDYLAAKAPDSRRFGGRNIYLGEYGMGKDSGAPEGQRYERIRQLMEAALGWGVRYAVYWQVFCNEPLRHYNGRPRNKDLRGFWLVRPDGATTPMWDTLGGQLRAALHRASFSSFSNQYFSVSADHSVNAVPGTRGDVWRNFTLKDLNGGSLEDGDTVTLQAHDGLYLTVEAGAGGRVFARSSTATKPELFTIQAVDGNGHILPGDAVAFQSVRSSKYLSTEAGGRGAIRALRPVAGRTEVFKYVVPEE